MNRVSCLALAGLLALSVVAPAKADRPDGWITAKVKMELLKDDHVPGTLVKVDTTDRRVTLHGKVDTVDQKERAERLAAAVEGVREVRNLLVVDPRPGSGADEVADKELRKRVRAALEADRVMADQDVRVRSVSSGVVVLDGEVDSIEVHQRALRVARGVPGVRSVASEIQSPNEAGDLVLWRAAAKADGKEPSNPDAWDPVITSRVKVKLLVADDLPGLAINVDSSDGVVTLFGIVPSEDVKRRSGDVAASVPGVVRVENELQVVPERTREQVEERDTAARQRVEARLEAEPVLEDTDIDVEVKDGVARLTGTVGGDQQRLAALVSARTTDGISAVVDDLRIEGSN